MPLILSQTFEVVTEESAADGDVAESGYDWQDQAHSFRDTVEIILRGGFFEPSDSHGVPRWLTCQTPDEDRAFYELGEHRTHSLHPAPDARTQRYWAKACRAAGINQGTY